MALDLSPENRSEDCRYSSSCVWSCLRATGEKTTIPEHIPRIGGRLMKRLIPLSIFVFFSVFQSANAQLPGMGMGMGMGANAGAMDERFLSAAPGIGELVPEIAVVDDQGNPVNIREVATGQYTVLVLGCLT